MKVKKSCKRKKDRENDPHPRRGFNNIKQQVEQEIEDDLMKKINSLDDTDSWDAIEEEEHGNK